MQHSVPVHIGLPNIHHHNNAFRSVSSASSPVPPFNSNHGLSRMEVDSMDMDSGNSSASPLSTMSFRIPTPQFKKPLSPVPIPSTSNSLFAASPYFQEQILDDGSESSSFCPSPDQFDAFSESYPDSLSSSSFTNNNSDLFFQFDSSAPNSPPLQECISSTSSSTVVSPRGGIFDSYFGSFSWASVIGSQKFPVLLFPEEIQFHILVCMSPPDIARLGQTCRSFYHMSTSQRLWKLLSKRDYSAKRPAVQGLDWRAYYIKISHLYKLKASPKPVESSDSMQQDATVQAAPPQLVICGGMKMCESRPLGRFVQTGTTVGDKIYFIGGQITSTRRLNNISCFDVSKTGGSRDEGYLEELNVNNEIKVVNDPKFCLNASRKGASRGMLTQTSALVNGEAVGDLITEVPKFARHVAAKGKDGTIVSFGGFDGRATFFGTSIFDPVKKTWEFVQTFGEQPALRSNSAADVVDGKFYLFGGSNDNDNGEYQILGDLWVLDLTTRVWTKLHEDVRHYETNTLEGQIRKLKTCRVNGNLIPEGRVGHRLIACGHKLYLIGGGVWSEKLGWSTQYYQMYVFDTLENRWYLPASENLKSQPASADSSPDSASPANLPVAVGAHPPAVCYPFTFVYKELLMTTTLEKKVWAYDTVAEAWHELPICGVTGESDIPSIAHSMGAVGVVGNHAFFLGSYHIGPGSPLNDFYRLTFNF